MAKLKMLKYPKKPKQSASVDVLENYLRKVKEVDQENARRKKDNDRREKLAKQVAALRPGKSRVSVGTSRRKKAAVSGVKRKKATAAKRATKRKSRR